ncbi:hypothetical protein HDU97_002535 [Phlyctochytrium planicorne]|nr:hypothetical protein HDU97_002535 [Phlyctochytrium planicorne]
MWSLYKNYNETYRRNLADPARKWVYGGPEADPHYDPRHPISGGPLLRKGAWIEDARTTRSSSSSGGSSRRSNREARSPDRRGDGRQSGRKDDPGRCSESRRGDRDSRGTVMRFGEGEEEEENRKREDKRSSGVRKSGEIRGSAGERGRDVVSRGASREKYASGVETPLSSRASESEASSGIPHSDTYEAVRDLNTELWKIAEDTAEDWNQVRDTRAAQLDRLYSETFDCLFRDHVETHAPPPDDIQNEIYSRAHGNNIRFPHLRKNNMGLFDLYSHDLSFDGMEPFLKPEEQLERLKMKFSSRGSKGQSHDFINRPSEDISPSEVGDIGFMEIAGDGQDSIYELYAPQ